MPLISATHEAVEVEPRRRHRTARVLLAVIATAALVVAVVFSLLAPDEVKPDPKLTELAQAERATALAYNEWQAAARSARCLEEHGYTVYPGVTAHRSGLPEVAELLGVEATRPGSFGRYLPPTGSREGLADVLARSIDNGGCRVDRLLVDLEDEEMVEALVTTASGDSEFLEYLAESLWADANKAELWSMYLAAAEPEPEGTLATDAAEYLQRAIEAAGGVSTWRASGIDEGATYLQAWGETVDGKPIILRIEPAGTTHPDSAWGVPEMPIVCGDVQMSLSRGDQLLSFDGPRRGEVFDIHRALQESWCAALEEGAGVR